MKKTQLDQIEIDRSYLSTKLVDNPVANSSYCTLTIGKLWSLVKLTKNWSHIFNKSFQQPETLTKAVERLMIILDGEQKAAIAAMQEEDLIDLHFSLGLAIRNAFGLHEPESELLASCHVVHPDDASGVIVKALWDKLVEGSV